jgi:hypothetical protein
MQLYTHVHWIGYELKVYDIGFEVGKFKLHNQMKEQMDAVAVGWH